MTKYFFSTLFTFLSLIPVALFSQSTDFTIQNVKFKSQGIVLAGSILIPKNVFAAVVIVHGSDPVKKELEFAKRLAQKGIAVLT